MEVGQQYLIPYYLPKLIKKGSLNVQNEIMKNKNDILKNENQLELNSIQIEKSIHENLNLGTFQDFMKSKEGEGHENIDKENQIVKSSENQIVKLGSFYSINKEIQELISGDEKKDK